MLPDDKDLNSSAKIVSLVKRKQDEYEDDKSKSIESSDGVWMDSTDGDEGADNDSDSHISDRETSLQISPKFAHLSSDSGLEATPSDEDNNFFAHLNDSASELSATPSDQDEDYLSRDRKIGTNKNSSIETGTFYTRCRARRKSDNPAKSAEKSDPNFKGVTLRFNTTVGRGKTKLVIESAFSCRPGRNAKRKHRSTRHHIYEEEEFEMSSDNEDHSPAMRHNWSLKSGKQCASCGTKKTPLWRDAEDGTPLCNACGIRYKKYRIRCICCWFVPRKASKAKSLCSKCGQKFLIATKR